MAYMDPGERTWCSRSLVVGAGRSGEDTGQHKATGSVQPDGLNNNVP